MSARLQSKRARFARYARGQRALAAFRREREKRRPYWGDTEVWIRARPDPGYPEYVEYATLGSRVITRVRVR